MKGKINGEKADDHYGYNPDTGELIKPEYTTMSRRPGIGSTWLQKYASDIYPRDSVVVRGVAMKPPKYYDNVIKTTRPYEFDVIKEKRYLTSLKHADNNSKERLAMREEVAKARLNLPLS